MKPSSTFVRYSDAEWKAIQAEAQAWKDCPPETNWSEIRDALEQMGRDFWALRLQRLRRPSDRDHKRLRQMMKLVQGLESQRLRATFESAYLRMFTWNPILEAWKSRAFQGHRDVHERLLLESVRLLWVGPLRGARGTSTDVTGRSGPLIRFFTVALSPIMGPDRPSPDSIRAFIRRTNKDLKNYPKFWKGHPSRRWDNPDLPPTESHVIFDDWAHYI